MDSKLSTGQRIKLRRKEIGVSAETLASKLGLSPATIYRYENGDIEKVPGDILEPISRVLQTTPAYLMGWNESPEPAIGEELSGIPLIKFPVIGSIAAGYDRCALEKYTGDHAYFPASELHADPDEYFVLRIKGNSMYPKLIDGDHVLVHRKESVDSGKIAVIIYDSEEATVKRVKYVYGEDWLELEPINPEYQTRRIENADLEQCRVLGEVVKLQRDL